MLAKLQMLSILFILGKRMEEVTVSQEAHLKAASAISPTSVGTNGSLGQAQDSSNGISSKLYHSALARMGHCFKKQEEKRHWGIKSSKEGQNRVKRRTSHPQPWGRDLEKVRAVSGLQLQNRVQC